MFVAMPTAIPDEPLTRRFGKRAGSGMRLCPRLVVVRYEVDRVQSMSRSISVASFVRRHSV